MVDFHHHLNIQGGHRDYFEQVSTRPVVVGER